MNRDFHQLVWDADLIDDCRQLLRLAVREDLGSGVDLTTVALVPRHARGAADIVARQEGIAAGIPLLNLVIGELLLDVTAEPQVADGQPLVRGTVLARLQGATRDLLTAERILLNFLGRLGGIATLTGRYVAAISGTQARLYDTRKTTPGWRRLEKYAVRCGGGHNHRTGLFDAVLIKDNHLAQAGGGNGAALPPSQAIEQVRAFLREYVVPPATWPLVEIEVDTLDQFADVLPLAPDIILLDNMPPPLLRQAVAQRDAAKVPTELEASGGVNLASIREIAESGVERISSGALTHSAVALDIALDWQS